MVASFSFPESELLAAIYALALMQAGIPARLQLGLGPRELVQPALARGLVDVVPEYLGTALTSLEPAAGVATSDPVTVRHELARALPVVHAGAAARYGARLVGALDAVSARLTTSDLIYLNRQITVAGQNVLAEARAWLERQGILPEPG